MIPCLFWKKSTKERKQLTRRCVPVRDTKGPLGRRCQWTVQILPATRQSCPQIASLSNIWGHTFHTCDSTAPNGRWRSGIRQTASHHCASYGCYAQGTAFSTASSSHSAGVHTICRLHAAYGQGIPHVHRWELRFSKLPHYSIRRIRGGDGHGQGWRP